MGAAADAVISERVLGLLIGLLCCLFMVPVAFGLNDWPEFCSL